MAGKLGEKEKRYIFLLEIEGNSPVEAMRMAGIANSRELAGLENNKEYDEYKDWLSKTYKLTVENFNEAMIRLWKAAQSDEAPLMQRAKAIEFLGKAVGVLDDKGRPHETDKKDVANMSAKDALKELKKKKSEINGLIKELGGNLKEETGGLE